MVSYYTIEKVYPFGAVDLKCNDGSIFKVNGQRVKHYHGHEKTEVDNIRLCDPN